MQRLLYTLLFICVSCANTVTNNKAVNEIDKVVIENKELEYEVIIIEPGFSSWMAIQKPMSYYSQSAIEIKNQFYVVSWNQRVLQPFNFSSNLYEMKIDYEAHVNYGLEVNYKLFMYFTYFQQKYRQKL